MKETGEFLKLIGRRIKRIRLNRNLLEFLFFVALASAFWFMQTLKETTTATKDYKLRIVGVPKNVIFTSDVPEMIKVNITGRGWDFLSYMSKNEEHVITVNYEDLEYTPSKITIDNTNLRRSLVKSLGSGLKVLSLTPPQIDVYYTTVKAKTVPVKFVGKVEAELQHVLCSIELETDSVQVYAPALLYDSIKVVQTEKLIMKNVEDTTVVRLALKKIEGTKFSPDSVDVKICVDVFSEKTVTAQIYCINCPHNKMVRTFPRTGEVTCRVSAKMIDGLNENTFALIVDYNKIKRNDKTCHLELLQKPDGMDVIRISPEYVDFLIEEVE